MRRVKITVFDNDYVIKTDADDEYLKRITRFIEDKVNEISANLGSLMIPRPMLLGTLKIADDYFRLQREFEEFKKSTEQKSESLVRMFDVSLEKIENSTTQAAGDD